MKLSIITPSYNQGLYLAETIESVISQAGEFFLDYIIVDGGSEDDSVAIIRHYEKLLAEKSWTVRCQGIEYRWQSESDRGQTEAIMKGVGLAKGEILAWLNSDDVYLPGTLQTMAAFFREQPETALVYGAAHYCNAGGEIIGNYPTEDFDRGKLAYFNFFCQPATFFLSKAFKAVGGLDDTLHYAMDYDLFVKISKQFSCYYLPRFLAKYRLHEMSKTVGDNVLFANHEEALLLSLKHFGWAPLTRVYGACYYYCLSRFSRTVTMFRPLVITAALFCTLFRSLWLNRGVRKEDLQLLRVRNFQKIVKRRMEILCG